MNEHACVHLLKILILFGLKFPVCLSFLWLQSIFRPISISECVCGLLSEEVFHRFALTISLQI